MNSIFTFSGFRRIPYEMVRRRIYRITSLLVLLSAMLAVGVTGCGDRDAVRVQLQAHPPPGVPLRRLEIRGQVTGSQTGLRYKWLSVAGECDPQETDRPSTIFKFADGTRKDRVSLEVWRDNKRVGGSDLDVTLEREPGPSTVSASDKEPFSAVQIAITNIPPYEPAGGPDTRAEIGGTVNGELTPDCKVIIYARAADLWFIQPNAYASHAIRADKTWSSWTHTGSSYSALVVRPGFDPVLRLDVLPHVGGYVVARAIVEGKKP